MDDFAEWVIRPHGGDDESGDSAWRLAHNSCGFMSNLQWSDDYQTVEDVLRWIHNHECPPRKQRMDF